MLLKEDKFRGNDFRIDMLFALGNKCLQFFSSNCKKINSDCCMLEYSTNLSDFDFFYGLRVTIIFIDLFPYRHVNE